MSEIDIACSGLACIFYDVCVYVIEQAFPETRIIWVIHVHDL